MRAVESPKDDFFAPRPKLSWNVRFIRAIAFLMAIGISIGFSGLYMFGIGDSYTGPDSMPTVVLALFWPTIWHIIVLLPCWRAWLLHRWACSLLTYILLLASVGAIVSIFWLGIIGFLLTATLLVALDEEELHLKSGF